MVSTLEQSPGAMPEAIESSEVKLTRTRKIVVEAMKRPHVERRRGKDIAMQTIRLVPPAGSRYFVAVVVVYNPAYQRRQ
jgi:hypothetical protein